MPPSFAKDELTIKGLVASNFLALCSTLLLLVFFGVIFLVAIFIPLFSLIFHWLPDPAPLSLLIDMHFTRQGRRTSAFGQVILFAADGSASSPKSGALAARSVELVNWR
jgi:hypothetical protein